VGASSPDYNVSASSTLPVIISTGAAACLTHPTGNGLVSARWCLISP
jgi:hypothetical protein